MTAALFWLLACAGAICVGWFLGGKAKDWLDSL